VKARAPESVTGKMERAKYPPPVTVRFAQFARKPTPNLMAVGGLSAELVVSQLVQTYIPAQYGNLMLMETSSIAPEISPEISARFKTMEVRADALGEGCARVSTRLGTVGLM
jgi:hypothetical protein